MLLHRFINSHIILLYCPENKDEKGKKVLCIFLTGKGSSGELDKKCFPPALARVDRAFPRPRPGSQVRAIEMNWENLINGTQPYAIFEKPGNVFSENFAMLLLVLKGLLM